MVHHQSVPGQAAFIIRLDKLHLNLAEADEGVAPSAGNGQAVAQVAAAGILGPEALLEPINSGLQVSRQVSNMLNLVKHDISLGMFGVTPYFSGYEGSGISCPKSYSVSIQPVRASSAVSRSSSSVSA
jgi:hypothetical protein